VAVLEVGVTPVKLPVEDCMVVLQNLGPGSIYFDIGSDVSTSTGMKLDVYDAYETPLSISGIGGDLFLVASQANTDVRYMVVG
jgi:hypothetical protein